MPIFLYKHLDVNNVGLCCWPSYQYNIVLRLTHKHQNVNAMSRLPLPEKPVKVSIPQELVLMLNTLEQSSDKDIRKWTKKDPTLSKVYRYMQFGWPRNVEPRLQVFKKLELELSSINDFKRIMSFNPRTRENCTHEEFSKNVYLVARNGQTD